MLICLILLMAELADIWIWDLRTLTDLQTYRFFFLWEKKQIDIIQHMYLYSICNTFGWLFVLSSVHFGLVCIYLTSFGIIWNCSALYSIIRPYADSCGFFLSLLVFCDPFYDIRRGFCIKLHAFFEHYTVVNAM